jgi:LysR family hydrogen peroxide-inducible transcriptional activator
MTFVQLEYIVALAQHRHFAKAAKKCFVTQPTLSMQIQKLEKELGIQIFDRSKQPVIPTDAGAAIVEQAQKILVARNSLHEIADNQKGILTGKLNIGIIPTLAPYLIPLFVKNFTQKFPLVKMSIHEMMTEFIINRLREGSIDVGILVTPLQEKGIKEHILFYEELLVYAAENHSALKKQYVQIEDIDPTKLWLLQEGHCFRSQIANLCKLRTASGTATHFNYEAGSIETLKRMVDMNDGITILPELSSLDMNFEQQQQIRHFKKPAPMREVSLVVNRDYIKKNLIEALKSEIISAIPPKIINNKNISVVPIF